MSNIKNNNLEKHLKELMALTFKVSDKKISNKSNFQNLKSWDSLNHVKLILLLESRFRIKIPPETSMALLSFNKIIKYLKTKINK